MRLTYPAFIAKAVRAHSTEIADIWLSRLQAIVAEDAWDIFPTDQYLDHIPAMIDELGQVIERHETLALALGNSLISRKALQLGVLRHEQKATVSQLLREYDILQEILENFVRDRNDEFDGTIEADEQWLIMSSISGICRVIMQQTVDAFVELYISTIEEQTEKLVSFNSFISHELRTPLQTAILSMDLVMEGRDPADPDSHDLLRVQSSIQQAASMIRNIENMIQIKNAVALDNPVEQRVDIRGLFVDITDQMADAINNRGVDVRLAESLGEAYIETAKLKLIASNLISNAIKYCDLNKPERFIEVSRLNSDENCLVLIISDNGLGMDTGLQKEIFDLRFRGHEELDEDNSVEGHGVGLYLVQEALTDLDGKIDLKSEVGKGTVFTLTLPLERHTVPQEQP